MLKPTSCFIFLMVLSYVECQQLKRTGARSAGRSACWRLFPLFNSGPTCLSLKIVLLIYIYIINIEVFVLSCSL